MKKVEKDAPRCLSCKEQMEMDGKISKKSKRGTTYRIRRFKCDLCDTRQTIWADNYLAELEERQAIEEASKL